MNNSLAKKVKKNKTFITGGLALLILIVVAWVGVAVLAPSDDKNEPPLKEGHVSISGELVCLPHKNTDGPQTLECAMGLKSDNVYYALKDESQKIGITPLNKPVRLEGMFKNETSNIYNIQGSITVEKIELKQ